MVTKRKTKETFTDFDAAQYLKSPEEVCEFIGAALEDPLDDPGYFAEVLGIVARAHGMSDLAQKAGVTREGLYKALTKNGNPSFGTVIKVLYAMGIQLTPVLTAGRTGTAVRSPSRTKRTPEARS